MTGLGAIIKEVAKAHKAHVDCIKLALKDTARVMYREAIRNAPRSVTAAQARAERKAKWKAKHGNLKGFAKAQSAGMKRRKANSHSRAMPGGLERSIRWELKGSGLSSDAEIFVARNAEAGAYAKYIHDEKGKKWFKRGPGTRRKGDRADEKFIERAVNDNRAHYKESLDKALKMKGF